MGKIKKLNLKGHLLTATSYLTPIVYGAGFLIAIGMASDGTSQGTLIQGEFSFLDALATMGGAGLGLLPVVITTGIPYSIAARPGIAPGFIIRLTTNAIGAGFIGGVLSGHLSGFLVLTILNHVKVPNWTKGLVLTLIIPFVASILGRLIVVYIIGTPVALFTSILTNFLEGLSNSSLLIFDGVTDLLNGVGYGRPINETVFAFILTMQAEGVNGPITALRLVNTATPIGFGLAYFVTKIFRKNIYTKVEVETLKSTVPMGVINIVGDVIPLVTNDTARGVVATAIGGFAGGAATMVLGADTTVPFGGVLMIPTMSRPQAGVIVILVNVLVTAVVLVIIEEDVGKEVESVVGKGKEGIDLGNVQIF